MLVETLLFDEALGLVEHSEIVEFLAVDERHVGVRVFQGVEPWNNPRGFTLGVVGLADRHHRNGVQRVELAAGQLQRGGAFTANSVAFRVLHAGKDHLILQPDAFHMGAGLQFEVQALKTHWALVFAEFSADLDQAPAVTFSKAIELMTVHVNLGGASFLWLSPHFTPDRHWHVAAHDDPQHGGAFVLFVAALEEDDGTVELAAHRALPLRDVHVSGGCITWFEAGSQDAAHELRRGFQLDRHALGGELATGEESLDLIDFFGSFTNPMVFFLIFYER